MAYQSFIVHILAVSGIFLALIAGNLEMLGVTNPWIALVVIPGLIGAHIYGSNQMKSIGQPPPSTVRKTTEETVTPPKD